MSRRLDQYLDERAERQTARMAGSVIGMAWVMAENMNDRAKVKREEKTREDLLTGLRANKYGSYQNRVLRGVRCRHCSTSNEDWQRHCYMCGRDVR